MRIFREAFLLILETKSAKFHQQEDKDNVTLILLVCIRNGFNPFLFVHICQRGMIVLLSASCIGVCRYLFQCERNNKLTLFLFLL